ncbi:MAG: citryl-CoA lyase [Patescibacteria group bacterium]
MKWNTAISTTKEGQLVVRGISLSELVRDHSFSEVSFLLLSGRLPSDTEQKLFDMMLVSMSEHGVQAPSAFSARVSASVGNPLHVAIAAGILATGDHHGGAIEAAAQYFQAKTSVEKVLAERSRFPGYGHKVYKDADPRAQQLLQAATELGIAGVHVEQARLIEKELAVATGKHLPLNIDGAIAALMLELGLDPHLGKPLFAFGRMPGMMAHALEEIQNEKPYRRLDDEDITYTGS